RGRHRQIRPVHRTKRREATKPVLVQPLSTGQILQPMLTQIDQLLLRNEVSRRLRDHDLAAVRGGRDPSSPMNIDPDIPLRGSERLTCVDADPQPDRSTFQPPNRLRGSTQRIPRTMERVEERVPLRIYLE